MTAEDSTNDVLVQLAHRAPTDDAAFARLVELCYPRLRRWAIVAMGDPDDADDVVQETLLRMQGALSRFRGDSSFTTWLYRLMRSARGDHGRRASRLRRLRVRASSYSGTAVERITPVTDIGNRRTAELVRTFWEELPTRQRQVLDLADFQGHDASEIAAMLDIEPVSVRAHLCKARRTIRERILECAPAQAEDRL